MQPRSETGKNLEGIRVLVIDDQPDARHLICRVLQLNGASVTAAASVGEALAVLRAAAPRVIISDISMPGSDGYDLVRALRQEAATSGIPAIAVSGHARAEDHERSLSEGFQAHLSKPVDLRELVATVGALASSWPAAGTPELPNDGR